MLAFGCVGGLAPLPFPARVLCLSVSMGLLVHIMYHVVRCLMSLSVATAAYQQRQQQRQRHSHLRHQQHNNPGRRMFALAAFNVVSWFVYPTVFGAREMGYLGVDGMNAGYALADLMARRDRGNGTSSRFFSFSFSFIHVTFTPKKRLPSRVRLRASPPHLWCVS